MSCDIGMVKNFYKHASSKSIGRVILSRLTEIMHKCKDDAKVSAIVFMFCIYLYEKDFIK